MSRSFTKNIANFMDLANSDATLLDNSAITAFSLWANVRTLDTGSPQNILFSIPNPGSASFGLAAHIRIVTGVNRLALRGRATATDSTRTMTAATQTFSTGQWAHLAGQVDWANDTGYLVTNGVSETVGAAAGWTATAFDSGAGTGKFRLGQTSLAAASLVAADGFDGLLAHVAFWTPTTLFTANEWSALFQGIPPWYVRPANLQLYRPLPGIDATEPDLVSHGTVTITGSVPAGSTEAPVFDIFGLEATAADATAIGGLPIGAIAAHQMLMRRSA